MAMGLYVRLPFGRLHRGNPAVAELAATLGGRQSVVGSLKPEVVKFGHGSNQGNTFGPRLAGPFGRMLLCLVYLRTRCPEEPCPIVLP